MAESHSKRPIEEAESSESEHSNPKRPKPINNLLSFLEEETEQEESTNQDLTAIFTTLQRELSSASSYNFLDSPPYAAEEVDLGGEDDGVESVMRRLLEASDDELGIPSRGEDNTAEIESVENLNLMWDVEDEADDCVSVLPFELLM